MEITSSPSGLFVRNARNEQGISLRHLAQLCQITPGYLSKIENGDLTPSPHVIKVLAEQLSYNVDKMFAAFGQVDPDIQDLILFNGEEFPGRLRILLDMPEEMRRGALDALMEEMRWDY